MSFFKLGCWSVAGAAAMGLFVTPTAAEADLVLHSSMDNADISGTTVADLVAPATDGELLSGASPGAVGQIGQAMDASVSGSAASVNYGDVLDVGTGLQTISLWFKPQSIATQYLIRKGNTSSSAVGWSVFLEDRGNGVHRVVARANAAGGGGNGPRGILYQDLTTEASVDAWHHVALIIDASSDGDGTLTAYLDGSAAEFDTNAWGSTFTLDDDGVATSSQLLLGVGAGGGTDVLLDDVAIFDHALTADEVLAVYNNGLAGVPVPEPVSAVLLATAGLLLLPRRRR